MLEKLKSFLGNDLIFHGVLLVLVSAASFSFGRLSVLDDKEAKMPIIGGQNGAGAAILAAPTPPLTASTTDIAAPAPKPETTGKTVVVGSKSGTKYHLPDCPGAKRIKPENLITFESIEAAKAAGYSAASNCKGLQ